MHKSAFELHEYIQLILKILNTLYLDTFYAASSNFFETKKAKPYQ
jgi:hypothetical protein